MSVLIHAPVLTVLGAFTASLALFDRTGFPGVLFLAPVFVLGFCFLSYKEEVRGQWAVLAVVLTFAFIFSLRMFHVLTAPAEVPKNLQVEGTVFLVRPWGKRNYVAVLDTPSGSFLMKLRFATLAEGMRLKVEGITSPLKSAGRSGSFDEERYWKARGVRSWLLPSSVEPLPPEWSLPKIRYDLYRRLAIYMPLLTGAYLRAAWTGQRDEQLYKAHRAWGTSHLLAVSGFHVGIVLLFLSFFLGRRGTLVISVLLWAYILLTGAAPSALRAGLMVQSALLGRILGRPSSPVNNVCLAAVLLLFHSPFLFWDVGWRLSVLATLTITILYTDEKRSSWKWLLISPAIALVTFPQVSYTFGEYPVVGLLLNLLATVVFSVALTVASLLAILRFLGCPFMPWLLSCVEGGFILWGWLAEWLRSLLPWTIPWIPFIAWTGAGTLFLLLCRYLRFSAGRTVLLTLAGTMASFWLF
ncbi:MAG: ComEC/Rec2 family competence protein [Fretibacterium sp.]|nr:ComEC/Rec2 family competence protein [Fretibacterium sp.]